MAVDLRRLNNIPNKTKWTVYGYIREHHALLKLEEYNIFKNIPDLIPSLCILYFDFCDFFAIIPNGVIYKSDDKKSISSIFGGVRRCYGSAIISSDSNCICKWDLKILNIPKSSRSRTCIKIGIASTELSAENNQKKKLGDRFYVHSNYRWCKTHTGFAHHRIEKMSKYYTGDVITITLNMKEKKVSFYNHTSKTQRNIEMKDFEGYEYRLAIIMNTVNISVCIDKFTQQFLD